MRLLKEIQKYFEVAKEIPEVRCTFFEDDNSCIALAKAPCMNPRTKFIALKYHHFREYVSNGLVDIKYVNKNKQTADIFTKALETSKLEYLCKKLCGF